MQNQGTHLGQSLNAQKSGGNPINQQNQFPLQPGFFTQPVNSYENPTYLQFPGNYGKYFPPQPQSSNQMAQGEMKIIPNPTSSSSISNSTPEETKVYTENLPFPKQNRNIEQANTELKTGATEEQISEAKKQIEKAPEIPPRRQNEITSHYSGRKLVYDNVMKDLNDPEKATIYSNIWASMKYLGVKYNKELEQSAQKYFPPEQQTNWYNPFNNSRRNPDNSEYSQRGYSQGRYNQNDRRSPNRY